MFCVATREAVVDYRLFFYNHRVELELECALETREKLADLPTWKSLQCISGKVLKMFRN